MKFIDLPLELQVGAARANALLSNTDHITVRFEKAEGLTLCREQDVLVIGYSRKGEALRGMSMAKRIWESGEEISQKAKFETLTLMADCSRNAVLKVEAVEQMMVELAMLGFTGMMLYTEDTYEIEGQPYFGHLRGRYSADELKALDAFGREVGIELIPCIQTLAHLNAIFNWSAYSGVRDVSDILVAEYEPTYDLIEQMLRTCSENFTTRKINIGMDEAHLLGRGAYLDKFGYCPKPEIMVRHLARVVELCKKYGLEPVMWSDMFFRMQFGGAYNVAKGELSQEVLDRIPPEVALCYWNYYTPPKQTAMLEHMFSQHVRTANDLWFAGGSWSWYGITPKNWFSNQVTPTQLRFAQKYGVKNIIATAWGDDGAECSTFAILPSLLQYAELNYGDGDEATLDARCRDCFGIAYTDFLKLDQVGMPQSIDPDWAAPPCQEKMALYNDPLLGILDADLRDQNLPEKYAADAAVLEAVPENRYSWLFTTQLCYARLLAAKSGLSMDIHKAYEANDKERLAQIVSQDIPAIWQLLDAFHTAFRDQWHTCNKPFGFEVQDIRMGGLQARLQTAQLRIQGYVDGTIERLEELEEPRLPYNHKNASIRINNWRRSSTAAVLAW